LAAITELDNLELQNLMARVEEKDLATALADPALDRLKERCLRNLPAQKANRMRDEWAWMKANEESIALAQGRVIEALYEMLGESFAALRKDSLLAQRT
jgi:flagellar motor switch protein FliG